MSPARARWGVFDVTADGGGIVLSRTGAAGETLLRCTLLPDDAGPDVVEVEPDEITLSGTDRGLRWSVRHTFTDVWHTRVVLDAGRDHRVGRLRWQLGGSAPQWHFPAGGIGFTAILGLGPDVLLTRPGPGLLGPGADLGPVPLRAGERRVLRLRTRPESLAEVVGALPPWLPPLELADGDLFELSHPDAAQVEHEPDRVSPWSVQWPVTLAGPDVEVWLRPCSADTVDAAVRHRAARLLADAPRRQDVPQLGSAAAALLVARGVPGVEAEEAAAAFLAGDAATPTPWHVLAAVEHSRRTGEPGWLAGAGRWLAELPLQPGAGVAAVSLLVALFAAGDDPQVGAAALTRWLPQADGLLALELEVLGGHTSDPSGRVALTLAQQLGAGLPGEPLPTDDLAAAHRIALLRWLPDADARRLEAHLAPTSTLAELLQRAERRLLAARGEELTDEALALLGTAALRAG